MVSKIKIYKLFNLFDYEIALKNEGVTILTGPNGYGKTTILKIIHAFANQDIIFFLNLVFEKIEFFTDKTNYALVRRKNIISVFESNANIGEIKKDIIDKYFEKISRETPYRRLGEDKWIDIRTNEIIDYDFVINKLTTLEFPELLHKLKSPIPKTFNVYSTRSILLRSRCSRIK